MEHIWNACMPFLPQECCYQVTLESLGLGHVQTEEAFISIGLSIAISPKIKARSPDTAPSTSSSNLAVRCPLMQSGT